MKRLMLRIIVYSISVVELEDGEKVEGSLIIKVNKPRVYIPCQDHPKYAQSATNMYAYLHVQQYLGN